MLARVVVGLLGFCSLASYEADRAVRVTIILFGIREFWRRVGGGARAIVRAWWCVRLSMEAEFLDLVIGGHGARLWCWFHKGKSRFAQI